MGRQKPASELSRWVGDAQERPVVVRSSTGLNVLALGAFGAGTLFLAKMAVFDILPLVDRGGLFILFVLVFVGLLAAFTGYCSYALLRRCFNPPSVTLSPEGVSLQMDGKTRRLQWSEVTSVEITRVDGPRGPSSWITFNGRKMFKSKETPLGDLSIPDIWKVELRELMEALERGRKRFSSLEALRP